MSWPEAQSYCRERFTDLATVDSMDDVNRLVNLVDAGFNGSVWIGLKRGTQTRWAWSNGKNKTSEYFNWAPGQPNEVWIGLHAVGVKRWVWSMGDISISQENMWHPAEPNGDGECVRSFNGSWYDESCSTVLPFVCFNGESPL
uniref:C-type lectin domain-containing protein n=1 Tax=Cyprinus carpio TaxID=7962 RepID=A0A8C2FJ59_CYPCA